jgi:hypothetical protein
LVSFSSLMIPVPGSAAMCARRPVPAGLGGLAGVPGIGVDGGDRAVLRAICHRPSVPSAPWAGSTSWPATSAQQCQRRGCRLVQLGALERCHDPGAQPRTPRPGPPMA